MAAVILASGCTSAKWVVRDREAVDTGQYEVIQEKVFLRELDRPNPGDPVLRLELLSRTRYEYNQKIRYERTIQQYRLRPGYVIAGLAGAGLGVYLGSSPSLTGTLSSTQRIAFHAAGGLSALVGFLSMKPVGEPQPTGEERLLNDTGSVIKTDTLRVGDPGSRLAEIRVSHNGSEIFSERRVPGSGVLEIGLGERLAERGVRGPDPGRVQVEVAYRDSLYRYELGVDEVLQPFARVTASVSELRSSPETGGGSVLAELVEGSRLRLIENRTDSRWYRVRYGLSENYLLKTDAELVWDTAQSDTPTRTVSVPAIPYGEVDVESNIPILAARDFSNRALVVTNEHYPAPLSTRTYAHRDGRLIASYLENGLGYYTSSVTRLQDLGESGTLTGSLARLREPGDSIGTLFVYLGGYARVDARGEAIRISYMLTGPGADSASVAALSLEELFQELSLVPARRKVVVLDLSFRTASGEMMPDESRLDLEQPIRRLSRPFLEGRGETALFVASGLNQQSALYLNRSGEDKKHRIFTYFFARAIQQRNVTAGAIQQFLERNVSYTSRRLHDRPQEPLLLGDTGLNLAGGR